VPIPNEHVNQDILWGAIDTLKEQAAQVQRIDVSMMTVPAYTDATGKKWPKLLQMSSQTGGLSLALPLNQFASLGTVEQYVLLVVWQSRRGSKERDFFVYAIEFEREESAEAVGIALTIESEDVHKCKAVAVLEPGPRAQQSWTAKLDQARSKRNDVAKSSSGGGSSGDGADGGESTAALQPAAFEKRQKSDEIQIEQLREELRALRWGMVALPTQSQIETLKEQLATKTAELGAANESHNKLRSESAKLRCEFEAAAEVADKLTEQQKAVVADLTAQLSMLKAETEQQAATIKQLERAGKDAASRSGCLEARVAEMAAIEDQTKTDLAAMQEAATVQVMALAAENTALATANATLRLSLASAEANPRRTFQGSNFKDVYSQSRCPEYAHELLAPVHGVVKAYCAANRLPKEAADKLFKQIQKDALEKHSDELLDEVPSAAERIWTSARRLRADWGVPPAHCVEFCTMLNSSIRLDHPGSLPAVATVTKAVNTLLCTSRAGAWSAAGGSAAGRQPSVSATTGEVDVYRGGGFDATTQPFFAVGKQYRVPGFLATSFDERTAKVFIQRSRMPARVLWIVRLKRDCATNAAHRCKHVNLVTKSDLPDEKEFLFVPYSAFTVLATEWRAGTEGEPHIITIEAAVDNVAEDEALPLAPWY
jgi:hypothetical protein